MWWGWVSLLGGVWWGVGGVLSLSRLTASNCGKGLPKVLQQLRQGFRRSGFRRCLARWLSVLLSLLGGCPFFLGCCVRVAPVARSAFPGRCRICSGCLSVWGFGSVCGCRRRLVLVSGCPPLSPLPLFQVFPLFFSSSPLKPPIILLLLYFLTPPPIIYYILLFI